jgi:hypothetical protein
MFTDPNGDQFGRLQRRCENERQGECRQCAQRARPSSVFASRQVPKCPRLSKTVNRLRSIDATFPPSIGRPGAGLDSRTQIFATRGEFHPNQ